MTAFGRTKPNPISDRGRPSDSSTKNGGRQGLRLRNRGAGVEFITASMASWSRRMAGNLHVSNLEDDLIPRLKRRAARHGPDADSGRSLYREISGAGRDDSQLGGRTAKQSIRRQIAQTL